MSQDTSVASGPQSYKSKIATGLIKMWKKKGHSTKQAKRIAFAIMLKHQKTNAKTKEGKRGK